MSPKNHNQRNMTQEINYDANQLFESLSVAELRLLEIKTAADIERKKQDLRIMVGERYRDVIDAANSITLMADLAAQVVDIISEIEAAHQDSIVGLENTIADDSNDKMYPIAAQIKLLVDTPEQVF